MVIRAPANKGERKKRKRKLENEKKFNFGFNYFKQISCQFQNAVGHHQFLFIVWFLFNLKLGMIDSLSLVSMD